MAGSDCIMPALNPMLEASAAAALPVLLLESVRWTWPGATQPVIDLPTLQLQRGQRMLLRGGSGCGKTTLLSLAAGVILADSGQVQLLGQDWRALRPGARDARRVDHVGYIFQQFNLLPYLSVLDNVLMPCRLSERRKSQAGRSHGSPLAAAQALLSALELPPALWHRGADALSVGQQQRVAAARALIGQPALVLADEPTSALDEDNRDRFMQLLGTQCAQSGCALLFVSHDARLAPHFDTECLLPEINRVPASGGRQGALCGTP